MATYFEKYIRPPARIKIYYLLLLYIVIYKTSEWDSGIDYRVR